MPRKNTARLESFSYMDGNGGLTTSIYRTTYPDSRSVNDDKPIESYALEFRVSHFGAGVTTNVTIGSLGYLDALIDALERTRTRLRAYSTNPRYRGRVRTLVVDGVAHDDPHYRDAADASSNQENSA